MSFQLRPYQSQIVVSTRTLMLQGVHSILIQSPTGSGKTALTAHMIKTAASKGMTAWFICHRRELIRQTIRAFADIGVKYGVCAAGWMEAKRLPVQIASVQTLIKRHARLPNPNLVIWDESHHLGAKSWAKLFAEYKDAYHIGLTATPCRLDGTGLGRWFQRMIMGPTVDALIKDGYLSSYRIFAPAGMNLSGVHTRAGDFASDELAKVADKPTITGNAIREYRTKANGKRAVVFAVSIEHSKHIVNQFRAAGIVAEHVDGETDPVIRDTMVKQFTDGKIQVLSNVELFGEGFDLPALEVAILLRPTQSLGLYLQQVGRVLRPFPGKTSALILDHAGNCERHGLPDEERSWTLEGGAESEARKEKPSVRVRLCPKCFAAQRPGFPKCAYCGFVFQVEGRKVDEKEGELTEVDLTAIRERRREQGKAQTLDELVALGRKRGYKRPYWWAKHVLDSRQREKLAGVRA